jgi:hypothetical protein
MTCDYCGDEIGNFYTATGNHVVCQDNATKYDALIEAVRGLVSYRDRVGPLNFQLEKADDFIHMMRVELEKVQP